MSSRSSVRPRISAAALFVNVTASTAYGETFSACTSHAMRCTSTRVLPLPAPATTSRLPGGAVTASRCRSLRPARICVTSNEPSNRGLETAPHAEGLLHCDRLCQIGGLVHVRAIKQREGNGKEL